MKSKKLNFHPIKVIGALVFIVAFILNIQTSVTGEWELVSTGIAQGDSSGAGDGCVNVTQPGGATVWVCDGYTFVWSAIVDFGVCQGPYTNCVDSYPN